MSSCDGPAAPQPTLAPHSTLIDPCVVVALAATRPDTLQTINLYKVGLAVPQLVSAELARRPISPRS
jgi:hypothetical protein